MKHTIVALLVCVSSGALAAGGGGPAGPPAGHPGMAAHPHVAIPHTAPVHAAPPSTVASRPPTPASTTTFSGTQTGSLSAKGGPAVPFTNSISATVDHQSKTITITYPQASTTGGSPFIGDKSVTLPLKGNQFSGTVTDPGHTGSPNGVSSVSPSTETISGTVMGQTVNGTISQSIANGGYGGSTSTFSAR